MENPFRQRLYESIAVSAETLPAEPINKDFGLLGIRVDKTPDSLFVEQRIPLTSGMQRNVVKLEADIVEGISVIRSIFFSATKQKGESKLHPNIRTAKEIFNPVVRFEGSPKKLSLLKLGLVSRSLSLTVEILNYDNSQGSNG